MSSSLYWRPAKRIGTDLPDALKFKLRERYGYGVVNNLDHVDVPFLEGLKACEINGAADLIEAINKHGMVEIYEE